MVFVATSHCLDKKRSEKKISFWVQFSSVGKTRCVLRIAAGARLKEEKTKACKKNLKRICRREKILDQVIQFKMVRPIHPEGTVPGENKGKPNTSPIQPVPAQSHLLPPSCQL